MISVYLAAIFVCFLRKVGYLRLIIFVRRVSDCMAFRRISRCKRRRKLSLQKHGDFTGNWRIGVPMWHRAMSHTVPAAPALCCISRDHVRPFAGKKVLSPCPSFGGVTFKGGHQIDRQQKANKEPREKCDCVGSVYKAIPVPRLNLPAPRL